MSRTEVLKKSWRVLYLLVSHAEMEVCARAHSVQHSVSWGGNGREGAHLDDAEYDEGEEDDCTCERRGDQVRSSALLCRGREEIDGGNSKRTWVPMANPSVPVRHRGGLDCVSRRRGRKGRDNARSQLCKGLKGRSSDGKRRLVWGQKRRGGYGNGVQEVLDYVQSDAEPRHGRSERTHGWVSASPK